MKRIKILFMSLSIILAISSCQKNVDIDATDQSNQIDTNDEVYKFLTQTEGLDPAKITSYGDYYFHDKCNAYSKADIQKYLNSSELKLREHRKFNGFRKSGWYNLNFSPDLPVEWREPIEEAAEEWNKLNGHIRFKTSESGQGKPAVGTIYVTYKHLASHIVAAVPIIYGNHAAGTLATDGELIINYNNPDEDLRWPSNRKLVGVHELGHIVALAHTNTDKDEFLYTESSFCNWHNNDNTDPFNKSVMRPELPHWEDFTKLHDCDILAYEALYERCFIRSIANNKYLNTENGNSWSHANRSNLGPWEKFKLKFNGDGTYSLLGNNNKYADLYKDNGQRVWFDQDDRYNGDCKWFLEKASSGHEHYRIKNNATKRFLHYNNGNEVKCLYDTEASNGKDDVWFIHRLVNCGTSGQCY